MQYLTPILQTVRPVLNRLNPSSQTGTSYQPRLPTETSPPGAAIVDLKRRGPALATTATQDSQAQSTVHCCIPRKKKGVRDAMDHEWPDRVCSHVTVGERNKTGLNSAGGRCWITQGEKNRRHKSPPDKKKKKNQIVALLTHDRNSCICILGLNLYRLINSYLPEGTLLIEYNTLSKTKKNICLPDLST